MLPAMLDWARERYPKEPGDSDFVYKQTIKAKACDAVRGMLPAATLSNVGIYGTGQGYEALLLRMRAHPLPEARSYAEMMLEELRKVDPVVPHAGRPARAGRRVERATSSRDPGRTPRTVVAPASSPTTSPSPAPSVTLTDFDPEGEDKVLAAICYPQTHLPEDQVLARVRTSAPTSASRCSRRTSGSATTAATSPAARSNAPATGSTCSPTTARSATCNVIACSRSNGSRSRRSTATRSPSRSKKPG